jgi:hypothetical protein
MKKIITLFAIVGLVAFSSCEGPEGPEGPPGYDGQNISEVFEVKASFNSPNYDAGFNLKPVIGIDDSLLVYELVEVEDGIDTWALLPQVYYFPQGTAQYNYDFSFDRFRIFIDANFNQALLPSGFTQERIFRVVILKGRMASAKKSVNKEDYSDYNAVIKKYNIDDSNVKRLN